MALDVGGRFAEAERGLRVAARASSSPSGSWHAYYKGDDVKEHTLDTNVTCYVANGVWHHYLATGDTGFLDELFPVVERAIDFALDHQHPTGEIEWDADPERGRRQGRAAHRLVEHLLVAALRDRGRRAARPGTPRLGAVARLARHRDRPPPRALPRQGTLGDGLVLPDPRRRAARPRGRSARRVERGTRSSPPGRGVRCVSDQPWITAAETCELVIALDAIGLARARAASCSRGCSSSATTTAATGPA